MKPSALLLALIGVVSAAASAHGGPYVCIKPYPPEAVAAGHEGTVTLAFTITEEGAVADLSILNSSGYPELDASAIECAANWRYKPAIQDSKPIAVPRRAEMRYGHRDDARLERAHQLIADIGTCVKSSPVPGRVPRNFVGITDLHLAVPAGGTPALSVLHSSGNEELDAKALECARASPGVAGLAEQMSASGTNVSLTWYEILGVLPQRQGHE